MKTALSITGIVAIVSLVASCFAAYITHLYWTMTTLFGEDEMVLKEVALAILGAFFPPIGVIHGFTIWF